MNEPIVFVALAAVFLVTYWLVRSSYASLEQEVAKLKPEADGSLSLVLSPVPDALILAYGIEEGFGKLPAQLGSSIAPWPTVLSQIQTGQGHIAYANKRVAGALMQADPDIQAREKTLCRYRGAALMIKDDVAKIIQTSKPPVSQTPLDLLDHLPAGKIAAYQDSDQLAMLKRVFQGRAKSESDIKIVPPSEDLTFVAKNDPEVIGFFGSVTDRVIGQRVGFSPILEHSQISDQDLADEINAFVYRSSEVDPVWNATVRFALDQLEAIWTHTLSVIDKDEEQKESFRVYLNKKVRLALAPEVAQMIGDEDIFSPDDVEKIFSSWFLIPDLPSNIQIVAQQQGAGTP